MKNVISQAGGGRFQGCLISATHDWIIEADRGSPEEIELEGYCQQIPVFKTFSAKCSVTNGTPLNPSATVAQSRLLGAVRTAASWHKSNSVRDGRDTTWKRSVIIARGPRFSA